MPRKRASRSGHPRHGLAVAGPGGSMGERRLDHAQVRSRRSSGDEQLRRLVAERDRVAALLRARRPPTPLAEAAAYRSSYAARLWALGEASAPAEDAPVPHLSLVEPPDPSEQP